MQTDFDISIVWMYWYLILIPIPWLFIVILTLFAVSQKPVCIVPEFLVTSKCSMVSDSASKHALSAFTDCLRSEVAHHNIKVSSINPGYIATSLSMNAVTGDGSTYGGLLQYIVSIWLFGTCGWVIKALNLRLRGVEFDSRSVGHV